MMFNRVFNRNVEESDELKQELEGLDELLIEEILYEDKKKFDRVRIITTRFLRKKFGSDKVDQALWRIAKRHHRHKELDHQEQKSPLFETILEQLSNYTKRDEGNSV